MHGRRVRPSPAGASAWMVPGLVLAIVVLSTIVSTPALHPTPGARPAPVAASSLPVSIEESRAALASLAHPATRVISPTPWSNLTGSVGPSPSPREGEALVYDPAGPYVLLFGGATGDGADHDTWTFAHGHWTNLTANLSTSPSSRYKAMATYDAADGYVLLFGGRSSIYFNDTWKWANGSWSHLASTTAPSPREDGGISYDPLDGYVVLFGGEDVHLALLNDTWSFHAGAWTNLTANLTISPPTREAAGMVWDSTDGYVLLFGGSNNPRGALHDTWSFVRGTWTNLTSPTAPSPTKRETLALADDPTDGFVLLFGGLKSPSVYSDSWAFSNGSWTLLGISSTPPARWGAGAAWDPNGSFGFVLLFGGSSSASANSSALNDTWSFKVPLSANLTSPGPTIIDLGVSFGLDLAGQGGYPGYSYSWSGLPRGCVGGNVTSVTCDPTAVGLATVTGTVNDSSGASAKSAPLAVDVVADPSVTGTLTPAGGDAPLTVAYAATPHGGVGPYNVTWRFGDGIWANRSNGTHTYTTAGTYTPILLLVDAEGTVATATGFAPIVVRPGLTARIVASPSSGTYPLPVGFTAVVTGGGGPTSYTYTWNFGIPGAVSTAVAPAYTYTTPGVYDVTLNLSDGASSDIVNTSVTVTAPPPLEASASGSALSGTAPLTVQFTGSAAGGVSPYTFAWSFGDGSSASSGPAVSHTYTVAGTYSATVTVSDSAGGTDQATVTITVVPAPAPPPPFNATFTFATGVPYCSGSSALAAVTLNATAHGGTAPYAFHWVAGVYQASGAVATITVPAGATTYLDLNATDAGGHSEPVAHAVTVGPLSCATSASSAPSHPNYLLLGLIVVIALVVAVEVVLLLRRRRR